MEDGTTKMAEAVFHPGGVPVADFRDPWAEACKKAKVPGKLFMTCGEPAFGTWSGRASRSRLR